jgi:hypothetical protein
MLEQVTLIRVKIIPEYELIVKLLLWLLGILEVKEAVVLSIHPRYFHAKLAELVNVQFVVHSVEEQEPFVVA